MQLSFNLGIFPRFVCPLSRKICVQRVLAPVNTEHCQEGRLRLILRRCFRGHGKRKPCFSRRHIARYLNCKPMAVRYLNRLFKNHKEYIA